MQRVSYCFNMLCEMSKLLCACLTTILEHNSYQCKVHSISNVKDLFTGHPVTHVILLYNNLNELYELNIQKTVCQQIIIYLYTLRISLYLGTVYKQTWTHTQSGTTICMYVGHTNIWSLWRSNLWHVAQYY